MSGSLSGGAPEWLADKRALLADAEFRALYRGYDQAARRLGPGRSAAEQLAEAMVRHAERREEDDATMSWDLDDPVAAALLNAHFDDASSPALERLHDLAEQRGSRG